MEELGAFEKVKINTGNKNEIMRLPQIGSKLADRIIEHRGKIGYFKSANDLAQVKGIGNELAHLLSPYIDWQLSIYKIDYDPPKKRAWVSAILNFMVALSAIWLSYRIFVNELLHTNYKSEYSWVLWWKNYSSLFSIISISISMLLWGIADVSISQRKARRISQIGLLLIGAVIVFSASYTLSYITSARLGLVEIPKDFIKNPIILTSAFNLWYILVFGTLIANLYNPLFINNLFLRYSFDIGVIIAGPIICWDIWISRSEVAFWLLFVNGLVGLHYIWMAVYSLFSGKSHYEANIALFNDVNSIGKIIEKIKMWQIYINSRVPDPSQQEELLTALTEMRSASITRRTSSTLLIGIGSWMILTILTAIVEWFVQFWLNTF